MKNKFELSDELDAVVIGTGCGGSPVLARLASAGLAVIGLEAGRAWNPSNDYAQDEVAQSKLYWLDERLSAGADPVVFGKNNSGCGVGGSSLHYGAFAPRPDPRDLRLKSEFGVGEDWPFAYAELVPYLEEAETFLGVSGPESYPWDMSREYPLPPLPINAPAQIMQRGCEAVGIKTSCAPLLTLSAPYQQTGYPERPSCANCGFCHQGCFNRSKGSMDVTYLPLAISNGAEIRSESFAEGFSLDGRGAIDGVRYRHQGELKTQRCKAVFLCGGGDRNAAVTSAFCARKFQRSGRKKFHGAYGDSSLGNVRGRRAAIQRLSGVPYQ